MKKELIIISGFLGSGKTTLLQNFILRYSSKKLAVILNDFGASAVDGVLLRKAGIKEKIIEIAGGSVFCSCLSASFVQTLTQLATTDTDLVLLEASGMSDPSTIDGMLKLAGLDANYEHRMTICVFDPVKSLKLAHVLEVIPRQLDSATVVVLAKADLYTHKELDAATDYIRHKVPQLPIVESRKGEIQGEFPCGQTGKIFGFSLNTLQTRPDSFQIKEIPGPLSSLLPFLENPDIIRVKGFVHATDGNWFVSDTGLKIYTEHCIDTPVPLTIITLQGKAAAIQLDLYKHHIL